MRFNLADAPRATRTSACWAHSAERLIIALGHAYLWENQAFWPFLGYLIVVIGVFSYYVRKGQIILMDMFLGASFALLVVAFAICVFFARLTGVYGFILYGVIPVLVVARVVLWDLFR